MGMLTFRQRGWMLAPARCLGCRGALVTGPFPTSLMEEMAYRYGVCVGCQLQATPSLHAIRGGRPALRAVGERR